MSKKIVAIFASLVITGISTPSHFALAERWPRSPLNERTSSPTDVCDQVLTRIMPTGKVEDAAFPKDSKWLITIRILPPFAQKESRLSLRKLYDGTSEGSVISPGETSFYDQCVALKAKNPSASVDEYLRQIPVRQETVSSKVLRELDKFASEIESISLSPVMPDELSNDSTRYEIWSQSQYGQRLEIIMAGPGPGSKKQPYPVLRWVESYHRLLEGHKK